MLVPVLRVFHHASGDNVCPSNQHMGLSGLRASSTKTVKSITSPKSHPNVHHPMSLTRTPRPSASSPSRKPSTAVSSIMVACLRPLETSSSCRAIPRASSPPATYSCGHFQSYHSRGTRWLLPYFNKLWTGYLSSSMNGYILRLLLVC